MSARLLLIGLLFVSAAGALVFGAHWYMFDRLVLAPAWSDPWASAAEALLIALGVTLVAQPIVERTAPPGRARRALAFVAYAWMGGAFYLVLLLALADAAQLVLPALPSRVSAGAVLLVAAVTCGAGLRSGMRIPGVRRVEIELERWPIALDGYRVAQITDIHIGPILDRRFSRAVTDRVNALSPDLIAVTGDLADGDARALAPEVAPFADLRAPDGVWFVTGNHELISRVGPWIERVRALGFRLLRNQHAVIERPGGSFTLAGVNDHASKHFDPAEAEDLTASLAGAVTDRPIVLLAHDPSIFRAAADRGVDLQISGHTHDGQMWPFRYAVRLVIPWVAGLYRRGPSTLYVSRGTGFWGPPMRVGAPSEITELILRSPQRVSSEGGHR